MQRVAPAPLPEAPREDRVWRYNTNKLDATRPLLGGPSSCRAPAGSPYWTDMAF